MLFKRKQAPEISKDYDPRSIVTPFAFEVSKELIGTPTAAPFRRLIAAILDILIILILMKHHMLALLFFTLTYWLTRKKSLKRQDKALLAKRLMILIIAGLVIFRFDSIYLVADSMLDLTNQMELNAVFSLTSLYSVIGISTFYHTFLLVWLEGHTLGKLFMGIKVVKLNSEKLGYYDSFDRHSGYAAALGSFGLGFLQIFTDKNRQSISDKIASTVVIRDKD